MNKTDFQIYGFNEWTYSALNNLKIQHIPLIKTLNVRQLQLHAIFSINY